MTNIYAINDQDGNETARIIADEAFVEAIYPGRFTLIGPVPEDPKPAPTYRTITKLQAIDMILAHSGMTDAQHLAFRKDQNLELFWMRWRDDVPTDGIRRDSPLTSQTIAAIVATGHMTQEQADALMAAWPTL